MIGKYERTYYQRKKASARMKKVWANRRKSIAMKAMIEARKAAGHTHHTNGKPYRTTQATTELNKIEQMFGAGTTFKMLTPEQRTQYYRAIDKRYSTVDKARLDKTEEAKVADINVIEKTLKPLQLLITVTVVGDPTGKMLGVGKMVSVTR